MKKEKINAINKDLQREDVIVNMNEAIIGEVINVDNAPYLIRDATYSRVNCSECAFSNFQINCKKVPCKCWQRKDGEEVYFEELTKDI